MNQVDCLTAVTMAVWLLAAPAMLPGQSPESSEPSRTVTPLRRLMDESLEWYALKRVGGDEPMTARVALRWANNTRGSEGGLTVIYLEAGLPHAVCSIYPWEQRLYHEFDSVSRSRIIGESQGVPVWQPEAAGVEFRAVPDVEVPAMTPSARLRQMKLLAGRFNSTMLGWRADKSDREALRLLPQPLYRYEASPTGSRFDGAVFAFVQGTDPEALLLIEAVRTGGVERWEYAFVRQTSGELEGRYQDVVVWHQDRYPPSDQPQSVHYSRSVILPADVLESLK